MKSILFLSVMNGSAWGGSEELWYQAALTTARKGYTTAVCCFDWKKKSGRIKELEKAGCRLFLLPGKKKIKPQSILGKTRLRKALAKVPFEEYDKVIVSQGGWKDVAHAPFSKLYLRLKDYTLIYHNYNVDAKFHSRRSKLMKEWVERASKNLGDTLKIFQVLEQAYSLCIPNQEKLFNPLTFDPPATATAYPPTEAKYIFSVFAALDTERKAQDILLRALVLDDWRNRNIELHLYGEGKDKELLQEMITELQLHPIATLKGNATDYREAIKQTHLVLQITHIDAMPITVMDSLAMARPLVVSNVGDMPSWINENENGWITDAVTVESIGETLAKAWASRDNWPAMGERSFTIFQKNFPADPIAYFLRQCGILSQP